MARVVGAGLISALASAALGVDCAHADGPFNFSPFASPPPPQASSDSPAAAVAVAAQPGAAAKAEPPRVRNDNPRTTASGFDPEALERGTKALREISSSPHGKKVWNFELFF